MKYFWVNTTCLNVAIFPVQESQTSWTTAVVFSTGITTPASSNQSIEAAKEKKFGLWNPFTNLNSLSSVEKEQNKVTSRVCLIGFHML